MLIPLKGRVIGKFVEQKEVATNIIVPFAKKHTLLLEVLFVGPECREIKVGDIGIVPPGDYGLEVAVVDVEDAIEDQFVVINEDNILALYREE